jgi:MFS family permease
MTDSPQAPREAFRHPGFAWFWSAETVSGFGDYVTVLALQVLVVTTLGGTAVDVGLLNASRWLPYLLFGLVLGVLVDRRRRRPILITTDLACAGILTLVPVLWWLGLLSLPAVILIAFGFGTLTLLNDSASQSFLPRLTPRALLSANARLDQSAAVAQTTGPLLGGALVTALSAPVAILADVASYLVSALALTRIRLVEPARPPEGRRPRLFAELAEGLRWVYRHRTLAPFALTTHGWFLFNSILGTVFVPFLLLRLGLDAFQLGVTLAAGGVGALVGSLFSVRAGLRWGVGRTVILSQALMPVAWAAIALVPSPDAVGGADAGPGTALVLAVLCAGQLLYGFTMGLENANEMAYRQAATPDALQGRMNTSIRSVNRAMIVVGAPLGGILADTLGYRPALWIGVAGFVAVTIALALSPARGARHGD